MKEVYHFFLFIILFFFINTNKKMQSTFEEEESLLFLGTEVSGAGHQSILQSGSSVKSYNSCSDNKSTEEEEEEEDSDDDDEYVKEYIPSIPWYRRPSILFILPVYLVAAIESSM